MIIQVSPPQSKMWDDRTLTREVAHSRAKPWERKCFSVAARIPEDAGFNGKVSLPLLFRVPVIQPHITTGGCLGYNKYFCEITARCRWMVLFASKLYHSLAELHPRPQL